MAKGSDTQLQDLIEKAQNGDEIARQELLNDACERLLRLTRKMFHGDYPDLRRWEGTDDVHQGALIRLHRALADVKVESVRHFFNLAAVQIRRTLLDLLKHHQGHAAKHHTDGQPSDDEGGALHGQADDNEPTDLEQWSSFHAQVDALSEEEREVVNLIFYEALNQEEAARVLDISLRTLKRRWHSARLKLHEALHES